MNFAGSDEIRAAFFHGAGVPESIETVSHRVVARARRNHKEPGNPERLLAELLAEQVVPTEPKTTCGMCKKSFCHYRGYLASPCTCPDEPKQAQAEQYATADEVEGDRREAEQDGDDKPLKYFSGDPINPDNLKLMDWIEGVGEIDSHAMLKMVRAVCKWGHKTKQGGDDIDIESLSEIETIKAELKDAHEIIAQKETLCEIIEERDDLRDRLAVANADLATNEHANDELRKERDEIEARLSSIFISGALDEYEAGTVRGWKQGYVSALERERKEIADLKAQIKEWEEKARNWCATPEAQKQLAGYRELGERVVDAENARDVAVEIARNVRTAFGGHADQHNCQNPDCPRIGLPRKNGEWWCAVCGESMPELPAGEVKASAGLGKGCDTCRKENSFCPKNFACDADGNCTGWNPARWWKCPTPCNSIFDGAPCPLRLPVKAESPDTLRFMKDGAECPLVISCDEPDHFQREAAKCPK